ncbi:o-succinylbenzoate synthase [Corynebacterium tapiri]|uniref:o-succinylbenzoate synthase n=1 Tax=Corynebacterium tapiri TaxID=1448266 RepID=A0A5C4U3D9_9CORY|nr:o-succinylbenzoate synthase [Corynebacterium tapiri]TNL97276.1 O-succinylbenzoate synthase [Corynebacterium tapiri]
MVPAVEEIIERAHVVALPMAVRFRGVDTREAVLIEGPRGWGEFAPFEDYSPREAAAWLRSGIEAAWEGFPDPVRSSVEVNGTIPAVPAEKVAEVAARFPGCQTFKVKVAEKGQTLADDIARVAALREAVPNAIVRVDANRGWNVDEAVEAAKALGPLDYLEQPCHSAEELAQVRMQLQRAGIFCRVAADESIRRSEDPYRVAELRAADVAVVKVAPLGGVRRTLQLASDLNARHMDITVASALDTAVGLNAGLAAVAALGSVEDDEGIDVHPNPAGLATQALFVEDVCEPRQIVDGHLDVTPQAPDPARLEDLSAEAGRREAWLERLRAAYAYL